MAMICAPCDVSLCWMCCGDCECDHSEESHDDHWDGMVRRRTRQVIRPGQYGDGLRMAA
jgi:hypothetical protein